MMPAVAAGDGVVEGSTGSHHAHAAPLSLIYAMRKYFNCLREKKKS